MGRYQAYPEYKDSGVEWLEEIPKTWNVKKIKWEITASSGTDQKSEDGVFELYGANGIIGKSNSSSINHTQGVVLVGRVGSAGSINYVQNVCAVSDNALIIKNAFSNVPRFDFYLLSSLNLEELVSKNAQPLITASNIRDVYAAVPFHDAERMHIANFLDHETAKIDTLIEKQQQLIQLLKEKRQAVISHAVTKGLNPNAPMKDSGVEWLGEVPEGWELVPLKYLCKFSGGGTPSKDNLSYWTGGDIPWVSPKDMKSFWLNETQDKLTEIAVKESSTNFVDSGALLMVVRSGILQRTIPIAINTVRVTLNQDMKALNFNSRMDVEYAANYILGNVDSLLLEWSKEGATVESIEHEFLANSLFPVPPVEEQIIINKEIRERMAVFSNLENCATEGIKLLQERRTALISAAVTGKIDVRHWQAPVQQ